MSPYLRELRRSIGHDLVLLPAAMVLPCDGDGRVLLVRQADTGQWATIGGSVEVDEDPAQAAVREAAEEAGVEVRLTRLVTALGGPEFRLTYPNGDQNVIRQPRLRGQRSRRIAGTGQRRNSGCRVGADRRARNGRSRFIRAQHVSRSRLARPVKSPSLGQAVGECVERGPLTGDDLVVGGLGVEPCGAVDLRELTDAARAAWPLQFEGAGLNGRRLEVALERPDGDCLAAGLPETAELDQFAVGYRQPPVLR